MENMKLHTDPLSRPYAKYLLRVGNGQEFSIIDHFAPETNWSPQSESRPPYTQKSIKRHL
jgi:hypothetical protein